jgi:hypothetical protein
MVAQVAKGLFFAVDVGIAPPIPCDKACRLSRFENLLGLMTHHSGMGLVDFMVGWSRLTDAGAIQRPGESILCSLRIG